MSRVRPQLGNNFSTTSDRKLCGATQPHRTVEGTQGSRSNRSSSSLRAASLKQQMARFGKHRRHGRIAYCSNASTKTDSAYLLRRGWWHSHAQWQLPPVGPWSAASKPTTAIEGFCSLLLGCDLCRRVARGRPDTYIQVIR